MLQLNTNARRSTSTTLPNRFSRPKTKVHLDKMRRSPCNPAELRAAEVCHERMVGDDHRAGDHRDRYAGACDHHLQHIEAFVRACQLLFTDANGHERRVVWLRYARWLVAALTFQLAADILETSITQSWESLVRIAAIAVIRTFLNYFLEKDVGEVRERDRERAAAAE